MSELTTRVDTLATNFAQSLECPIDPLDFGLFTLLLSKRAAAKKAQTFLSQAPPSVWVLQYGELQQLGDDGIRMIQSAVFDQVCQFSNLNPQFGMSNIVNAFIPDCTSNVIQHEADHLSLLPTEISGDSFIVIGFCYSNDGHKPMILAEAVVPDEALTSTEELLATINPQTLHDSDREHAIDLLQKIDNHMLTLACLIIMLQKPHHTY